MGRYLLGLFITLILSAPALAQGSFEISPGDTLQIEVLEDPDLNRTVLVLPDGTFSFPLVGTVRAGGRSVDQVQSTLISDLAPNFAAEPNVFVSVAQLAAEEEQAQQVAPEEELLDAYIMGEIAAPGRKQIPPGTTILQLLAASGGVTEFAARDRIQLRRTDPETGEVKTYIFSYTGHGRGPRIRGSTRLAPGDVVVVPERGLFE